MAMNYALARIAATNGFEEALGREPTLPEVQFLMAVGGLETSYGTGWQGAGKGSYNMGAITAGTSWKGQTFEYMDSYPDADGKPAVRYHQVIPVSHPRDYPG